MKNLKVLSEWNLIKVYFFLCAPIFQGSPVFQTETSECEYIFSWETPAACALEVSIFIYLNSLLALYWIQSMADYF